MYATRLSEHVNKLFYLAILIFIFMTSCTNSKKAEKPDEDRPVTIFTPAKDAKESPIADNNSSPSPNGKTLVRFSADPRDPIRAFIVRLYAETQQTPINGSGVIIGRRKIDKNHFYYVLTAKHVIEDAILPIGKLTTLDKLTTLEKSSHDTLRVFKFKNVDLAIIEFSVEATSNNYQYDLPLIRTNISKIRDNFKQELVNLYGYRSCESKHNIEQMWEKTSGQIIQFDDKNRLGYNANTVEGMSGSGVFLKDDQLNNNQLLIAIHTNGGMKKQYDASQCNPLNKFDPESYSSDKPNFGVPMYLFREEYEKLQDFPNNVEIRFEENQLFPWFRSPQ